MEGEEPVHAPAAGSAWVEILVGRPGVYTAVLNFGILLVGVDSFAVNTLMPTIVEDIGGVAWYAWVGMLFIVGAIVGSASFAPLRTTFGSRNTLAMGGAIFTVAALGCSLAPSMPPLLAARLVEGWGGGLMIGGSMHFAYALYEPRLRTRVIAFTSITYILAAVVGPILGGIFAQLGWWRGAFLLYVPFGAACIAGVLLALPEESAARDVAAGGRVPIWRLLMLGTGVVAVGAAGLVPGALLRVLLLAAAAALVWRAFERDAHAENRLFPSAPLSINGRVGLGNLAVMLLVSTYISISIFLPLVLTVVYGIAPFYVGFANAAMSIAWSILSGLVAGLHGGKERRAMLAGPLCVVAATAGLAASSWFVGSLPLVIGFAILIGAGIGCVYVHMMTKVMEAARPGEESITASSLSTVRALGQAFGSAIAGAVANIAGLEEAATQNAVRDAATGVYLFNLVPVVLAVVLVARFFRVRVPA